MTAPRPPAMSVADQLNWLDNQPPLLPIPDLPPLFGKSEQTIRTWVEKGALPSVKVGGGRFVRQQELRQVLGLPPIGSQAGDTFRRYAVTPLGSA